MTLFALLQKKSRDETHGEGSGVEILVNEPYQDGPGGSGQYTHKIYHVGSHLPGEQPASAPVSYCYHCTSYVVGRFIRFLEIVSTKC